MQGELYKKHNDRDDLIESPGGSQDKPARAARPDGGDTLQPRGQWQQRLFILDPYAQLLREYQMGVDLNQAMRNASNRIASPLYRLTFTAIEMHRVRGGNAGESLDRIAESVREIHRLEGKLDALTSQGRAQAWMMAGMAGVFIVMYYFIAPESVGLLFTNAWGRIILLAVVFLIVTGFLWIQRILDVDI